jgi:hypothetical protein
MMRRNSEYDLDGSSIYTAEKSVCLNSLLKLLMVLSFTNLKEMCLGCWDFLLTGIKIKLEKWSLISVVIVPANNSFE